SRPNTLLLSRSVWCKAFLLRGISGCILFRLRNQANPSRLISSKKSQCADRRTFSGVGPARFVIGHFFRRSSATSRGPLSPSEAPRVVDAANSSLLGTQN